MTTGQVPPIAARTKDEVQKALAADWLATSDRIGCGALADKIKNGDTLESALKKIGRTIGHEHLPEAHTILNSLVADDAALFNVFRLFGGCFVRIDPAEEADFELISKLMHAATEALDRKKDGFWCPSDKAALSKLFKALIPAMLAINHQAEGI